MLADLMATALAPGCGKGNLVRRGRPVCECDVLDWTASLQSLCQENRTPSNVLFSAYAGIVVLVCRSCMNASTSR